MWIPDWFKNIWKKWEFIKLTYKCQKARTITQNRIENFVISSKSIFSHVEVFSEKDLKYYTQFVFWELCGIVSDADKIKMGDKYSTIKKIAEIYRTKPEIQTLVVTYLRLFDFYYYRIRGKEFIIILQIAQQIDAKATRISDSELDILLDAIENATRSTNLDFELSLSQVSATIAIVSAIFLTSGYLYTDALLGYYGISSNHYFTITDYLSASLEQLDAAFTSSIFAFVGLAFGGYRGYQRAIKGMESPRGREWGKHWITFYGITFVPAAILYVLAWRFLPMIQFNLLVIVLYVFCLGIAEFVVPRIFKRAEIVSVIFLFLAMFTIQLSVNLFSFIYNTKYSNSTKYGEEIVYVNEFGSVESIVNPIVLTVNSNFVFMYFNESKLVQILPKARVLRISVDSVSSLSSHSRHWGVKEIMGLLDRQD